MLWMRFLPYILAAGALLGALGYVAYLRSANASLSAENASLGREIAVQRDITEQARLAREVEAAHRKRESERAAELQRGMEALLKGDFADADTPIDPRITAYLGCLRRTESRDTDGCARHLTGPTSARPDQ